MLLEACDLLPLGELLVQIAEEERVEQVEGCLFLLGDDLVELGREQVDVRLLDVPAGDIAHQVAHTERGRCPGAARPGLRALMVFDVHAAGPPLSWTSCDTV